MALMELICAYNARCPFFLTEEEKREKDAKTEARLREIMGPLSAEAEQICAAPLNRKAAPAMADRRKALIAKRRKERKCLRCGAALGEEKYLLCANCRNRKSAEKKLYREMAKKGRAAG